AAPFLRHRTELLAQLGLRVGSGEHANSIAGLLETRDGLPHLANRAAVERELARANHSLVTEVDRPEAERVVVGERLVRRAGDRDAPAFRMRDAAKFGQQLLSLPSGADRVARDERSPGDYAVREKRA